LKLILKLEVDELNKHWVEIEVSEADFEKDPTDMRDRLNLAWTSVRNGYRKA
jgi:hypothetical protein